MSFGSSPAPAPAAVEEVKLWRELDRMDNDLRDQNIRRLAAAYDGSLFDLDAELGGNARILSRTLKDESSAATPGAGSNPRFSEIVAPFIRSLTEDWKSVTAFTPSVSSVPAAPEDDQSQKDADFRELIVQGIYADSWMPRKSAEAAHFASLMGAKMWVALPDFKKRRVYIYARSPYKAYGRELDTTGELAYCGWEYEMPTKLVLRQWPDLETPLKRKQPGMKLADKVTIAEFLTPECRVVLVDGEWVKGMPYFEHGWGFVPARITPNVLGVGLWGRSDAQQVVHMAQIYSELLSMSHDGVVQAIYDPPVFFDDVPIRKIDVGPREGLQLSANAKIGTLHGSVKVPEMQNELNVLERLIRIGSGWPEVFSSEMDSSVISGKAFAAAQGPVAARAAVKHLITAMDLEAVNRYALMLYELCFPSTEITLVCVPDTVRTSVMPKAGRAGTGRVTFIPKRDIAGQYITVCTFPPMGTDRYRAGIQMLQYKEAGLISDLTIQEQDPTINPYVEQARIERQQMNQIRLQIQAAQMMAQAQAGMMQTQQGPGPGPQGPGGPPPGPEAAGAAPAPAGPPPGAAPPGASSPPPMMMQEGPGGPPAQAGAPARASRDEVKQAVANTKTPIRGKVYLMGAIARQGWVELTPGQPTIEMGFTDPQDKGTVFQQTTFGQQQTIIAHTLRPDSAPSGESVVNITPVGR